MQTIKLTKEKAIFPEQVQPGEIKSFCIVPENANFLVVKQLKKNNLDIPSIFWIDFPEEPLRELKFVSIGNYMENHVKLKGSDENPYTYFYITLQSGLEASIEFEFK